MKVNIKRDSNNKRRILILEKLPNTAGDVIKGVLSSIRFFILIRFYWSCKLKAKQSTRRNSTVRTGFYMNVKPEHVNKP